MACLWREGLQTALLGNGGAVSTVCWLGMWWSSWEVGRRCCEHCVVCGYCMWVCGSSDATAAVTTNHNHFDPPGKTSVQKPPGSYNFVEVSALCWGKQIWLFSYSAHRYRWPTSLSRISHAWCHRLQLLTPPSKWQLPASLEQISSQVDVRFGDVWQGVRGLPFFKASNAFHW